jgi:hypothetical protein
VAEEREVQEMERLKKEQVTIPIKLCSFVVAEE